VKLTNGRMYTMLRPGQTVSSIRLEGESIAALDEPGPGIDLNGCTVLPGFCDAHTHFYYWAHTLDEVELDGVNSLDGALKRIAERCAQATPGAWIQGRGFNKNLWNPPQFPTRQPLDLVAPDRPVAIFSKDEHSMWANSEALRRCGITAATQDPPGGVIQRDAHGEPTGMLFEKAYELVLSHLPTPDPAHASAVLDRAAGLVHVLGVTSAHDMCNLDAWHAYRSWAQPTLDLVKYIRVEDTDYVEREKLKSRDGTMSLTFGGFKLFTDGALGSQTAHMWEPYEGAPGQTGVPRLTPAELKEYLDYAQAHEQACAIHAIGDRANSEVIAEAATHPAGRLRHRIEHAQSVRPQDVATLAASGWIASMQPSHLVSDRDTALRHWGERRSRYAFPIHSLHRAGVPLAFGSDVPIEPVDPLFGIHAACCRMRPGDGRGPWEPGERLDRFAAVAAFTSGAAYAAGQESRVGTLAPGRRGNLVILDRDLLAVPEEEILQVQVLATIQAGKVRHVNRKAAPRLAETLATFSV
jgi:predicted amidohydrolase YtcJ